MRTLGVIVAGGRSSRMGREKAVETLRGRTIVSRIMSVLTPQVETIVINANGDASRFSVAGLSVVADLRQEVGTPLAGLHTALSLGRAGGYDAVLTVPSDAPFLPSDLVARLVAAERPAAIAASGGQAHYLTGLWSPGFLGKIEHALAPSRFPRLQDWARDCDAAIVEWPSQPYDPFFNVNTPEELAEAERIAAEFGL
jgi:molybdopterin-guanine dinucleotide biosynthesis protein A